MILRERSLLLGRSHEAAERDDAVSVGEDHDDGDHGARRVDHVAIRFAEQQLFQHLYRLDGSQQPVHEREDVGVEVHLAGAPAHQQGQQHGRDYCTLDEKKVDFLKATDAFLQTKSTFWKQ